MDLPTSVESLVATYASFGESAGVLLTGPSQGLKIRGGLVVLCEDNVPLPPVEIGLTDLPKTGGAEAPPAPPPFPTGLLNMCRNE